MPGDDLSTLRAEWVRARYAILRMDTMSPIEQEELARAVTRIDARFDRFEAEARDFRDAVSKDVAAIRADIDKIKGMARLAAWFVGAFGGVMALLTVVVMAVTRQQ